MNEQKKLYGCNSSHKVDVRQQRNVSNRMYTLHLNVITGPVTLSVPVRVLRSTIRQLMTNSSILAENVH